ncbi:hypothetical protein ACIG47_13365 [Promicromonospora sp. NPDC052451]|uniref:hypothetical protein n=1 Tax=Promicromonospora sp. NPDC052451 TaxID=3364407 RepID=UPI0037CAB0DF
MTAIYASQFSNYLAAAADGGESVAHKIRSQLATPYQPGCDHWRPVKLALFRDRRGSRDGQELADIAAGAAPRRQPSYTQTAGSWARLAPLWDGLVHEPLGTKAVQVGDLTVKVPRLPAERHPGGKLEALYVRFNQIGLAPNVVYGVLRIVQRAHPGTEVTFVDVPRLTTYSSHDRDLTLFDEWLTEAGNDLANLLDEDQDQAHAA